MPQNIVILLTEGDHDAAFLYRILKANGFAKYSRIIREFPQPLDKLLAADILNISVPDESIQNARTRFLPSNVVTRGNNMLFIYAMQGDSRSDKRIKLIDAFNALNTKDKNEIQAMEDTTIKVLYFLDADERGIKSRLDEINNELQVVFSEIQFEPFTVNSSRRVIDDIEVGVYIFTQAGKDTGKLEDILLPLMETGNEDVFSSANTFLAIHENTKLYKGNVEYNGTKIKKVFKDKYDYKKSLLGTIGQLHKSGKSNTVCISDTHYLNDEKLTGNNTCKEIVAFITGALI